MTMSDGTFQDIQTDQALRKYEQNRLGSTSTSTDLLQVPAK